MAQKTLNSEERSDLRELVSSEGYKALSKLLDNLLLDRQRQLTNYDLTNGSERLCSIKAEYDGAKKFLSNLRTALAGLKK